MRRPRPPLRDERSVVANAQHHLVVGEIAPASRRHERHARRRLAGVRVAHEKPGASIGIHHATRVHERSPQAADEKRRREGEHRIDVVREGRIGVGRAQHRDRRTSRIEVDPSVRGGGSVEPQDVAVERVHLHAGEVEQCSVADIVGARRCSCRILDHDVDHRASPGLHAWRSRVQRQPGPDDFREHDIRMHDERVVMQQRILRAVAKRRHARDAASVSSSAAPRVERHCIPSHSTHAWAIVAGGAPPLPTPITTRAGSPSVRSARHSATLR